MVELRGRVEPAGADGEADGAQEVVRGALAELCARVRQMGCAVCVRARICICGGGAGQRVREGRGRERKRGRRPREGEGERD